MSLLIGASQRQQPSRLQLQTSRLQILKGQPPLTQRQHLQEKNGDNQKKTGFALGAFTVLTTTGGAKHIRTSCCGQATSKSNGQIQFKGSQVRKNRAVCGEKRETRNNIMFTQEYCKWSRQQFHFTQGKEGTANNA